MGDDDRTQERDRMVTRHLQDRGVRSPRVLDAFRLVPRERFVPVGLAAHAYDDRPLEIGDGQTISQPYIAGVMVEALDLEPTDRVLEVGAGSGYAAAIVSRLCQTVIALERIPALAQGARERLHDLGYDNIDVVVADGTLGWSGGAPFDAILVSAAAGQVPSVLMDQLAPGGRLVIPVGPAQDQELFRITKGPQGVLEPGIVGRRPLRAPRGRLTPPDDTTGIACRCPSLSPAGAHHCGPTSERAMSPGPVVGVVPATVDGTANEPASIGGSVVELPTGVVIRRTNSDLAGGPVVELPAGVAMWRSSPAPPDESTPLTQRDAADTLSAALGDLVTVPYITVRHVGRLERRRSTCHASPAASS